MNGTNAVRIVVLLYPIVAILDEHILDFAKILVFAIIVIFLQIIGTKYAWNTTCIVFEQGQVYYLRFVILHFFDGFQLQLNPRRIQVLKLFIKAESIMLLQFRNRMLVPKYYIIGCLSNLF